MNKSKKLFTNIYIYSIALIAFLVWLVSFMSHNELLKVDFDIESIGFVLIGIIVFIVLSLIKDSFYMMPLLMFTPFVFARGFSERNIPLGFFIVIGLAVLGIIVHIVRFRAKVNLGVYFFGLDIFLIGIVFGGITKSSIVVNVMLLVIGGLLILAAYSFIVTYLKKHEFNDVAHMMLALGLILIFEALAQQFLLYRDTMFQDKTIVVGWGISNNIALLLLLCTPFVMFLASKAKGLLNFVYLGIVLLFSAFLLLTYSRGALLVALLVFPIGLIYSFIQSKNKLSYGINLGIIFIGIVGVAFLAFYKMPGLFDLLKEEISNINLSTLNGRNAIYEEMLLKLKDDFWFGKGIFNSPNADGSDYLWGHNVYIHTIYTLGFFGLCTLLVHLFQKYYLLLKKPTPSKTFVAIAFLASGLYGLMDVSYFYLNFMIVLIALLALVQYEIEK